MPPATRGARPATVLLASLLWELLSLCLCLSLSLSLSVSLSLSLSPPPQTGCDAKRAHAARHSGIPGCASSCFDTAPALHPRPRHLDEDTLLLVAAYFARAARAASVRGIPVSLCAAVNESLDVCEVYNGDYDYAGWRRINHRSSRRETRWRCGRLAPPFPTGANARPPPCRRQRHSSHRATEAAHASPPSPTTAAMTTATATRRLRRLRQRCEPSTPRNRGGGTSNSGERAMARTRRRRRRATAHTAGRRRDTAAAAAAAGDAATASGSQSRTAARRHSLQRHWQHR